LQWRFEGDWQILKVFCQTLMRDFLGFLGVRASKNVGNIGSPLTSQDLSVDTKFIPSKSRDTVHSKYHTLKLVSIVLNGRVKVSL